MKANVGGIDRILRIAVGAILIALTFAMPSTFSPWGWIGVIPLATGALGWCPLYLPIKLNTAKKD